MISIKKLMIFNQQEIAKKHCTYFPFFSSTVELIQTSSLPAWKLCQYEGNNTFVSLLADINFFDLSGIDRVLLRNIKNQGRFPFSKSSVWKCPESDGTVWSYNFYEDDLEDGIDIELFLEILHDNFNYKDFRKFYRSNLRRKKCLT